MNPTDRLHWLAEAAFLREQLQTLPATAKLTRMSTESRLQAIETLLGQESVQDDEPRPD